MKGLIAEQVKKDFSKLRTFGGRFAKQKEENNPKVIPPKEEAGEQKEEEIKTSEENMQDIQEEQEQLPAGFIIKYAKELTYEVVDEEGNRIPCKTIIEAEILSRLIELRSFFLEQK